MAVNVNNGTSLGDIVVLPLKGEKGDGVTQLQNEIDIVNDRIDQLIAPTGEAPSASEITDARMGADGTVYNTLGTAIRTQFDTTPNIKSITPATFSNKLSKVNKACVIPANSNNWTDLPSGITAGTFINHIYDASGNYALQIFATFPEQRLFSRVVNYNSGAILKDWKEYAFNDVSFQFLTLTPSTYNNQLSKIDKRGFFIATSSSGWTDLPDSQSTCIVFNYAYNSTGALQVAHNLGDHVYVRYVNPSTGAEYFDGWHRVDGSDNAIVGYLNPADYDGLLANVTELVSVGISSADSGWEDLPENDKIGAYIPIRYTTNAILQVFVSYPTLNVYIRMVLNRSVAAGWRNISNGSGGGSDIGQGIVYYALGDSITAGSYSTDDGQGVVAHNAEWAYPNRIGARYGCTVHNLGVAGAPITQFANQVSQVGSDATIVTITGGANDYYGQDKPLGDVNSAKNYDTVCGALKSAIESIASTAPNARIILMSPLIIKYGSLSTKWSMNYASRAGFTYQQLSDAMKAIAEMYNIEFFDGTHSGPTSILNISDAQKDGVHPTKVFYKTYANWVGSKLF